MLILNENRHRARCSEVAQSRHCGALRQRPRKGLTLVELLIALTILVLTVGALGGLAKAVQQSAVYGDGHRIANQHGRVILERIGRMVQEAHANEQFPGCLVVSETIGSWRFPDTLIVWHPDGQPADPEGLPRFDELVIYTPSDRGPNQLLEIEVQVDSRTVPAPEDTNAWLSELESIRKSADHRRVTLSGLMRVCTVAESNTPQRRAAVRFVRRLRPSEDEWTEFRAGSRDWDDLIWSQGIHGAETGLRQTWVRTELQLMPGEEALANDPAGQQAVPFFGSATLYYELPR